MAKTLIKWAKETGVSTLAIPAKLGNAAPDFIDGQFYGSLLTKLLVSVGLWTCLIYV